ncbi:PREDICTED: probable E3 ubiquitin-protein ligase RHY1A [Tarenaya hassleriana]|uniref:probable E3 ubiquitin-protein ligase RHY1A n=1 Tax=Tarenaya hassleriana TaxID=28532 RepID=UPI00053C9B8E|nr:PREDICTED: probable E3 ubiquitin-protein ligase RHY1A [Tarenaya hassleriana]
MTSASELFYTRRSRLGRPDPDLGSDPSLNRSFHHDHHDHHRRHRQNHQTRHNFDGCDSLRRASRLRQFAFSERRPNRNLQSTTQVLSRNSGNGETQSVGNWGSLNETERLPGAVLLARARLVERLRGVSFSGNRGRDSASRTSLSLIDTADTVPFFPDLTSQPEGSQLSREYNKKPHGLTRDAINGLHRREFISSEVKTDCSICLESFRDGDVLISLLCSHSFHSSCLVPWLRTCGECPYCRRAV